MIATGVDIESTGIDFLSGHKIIEIAMVKYEIETQAMVDSFVMRFNPRRSIDPKAQAVHGICLEDLAAEPLLADHASSVASFLSSSDIWIAHNGEAFDIPFIRHELKSYGFSLPDVPLIDTLFSCGPQKTANGRDWRNSPSHWVLSMTRLRRTARSMIPI